MYKLFGLLFLGLLLFGCSGNPTAIRGVEIANKKLHKERSPIRLNVEVFEGGGAVMSPVWAGEKDASIINFADETLKADIYKLFQEKCGFQKTDLKEVRVVEHKPPFYYEVWVFNDTQSKNADGTTGVSLILNLPASGGTDINLIGNCRS